MGPPGGGVGGREERLVMGSGTVTMEQREQGAWASDSGLIDPLDQRQTWEQF